MPNPKLPGTIHSAAEEIEAAGGKALAVAVRHPRRGREIAAAVKAAVDRFGGIDVLVNNASAIHLAGTVETPMKRYDLMHQVNARGTFACSQACIPHLEKSANPHILNLSPPLSMNPRWFAPHVAYTMAKYGMSLCVLGMAEELASARHRGERALAAHRDRHRGAEPARRRGDREARPHAGDRRRRGRRDPEARLRASCTGNFFLDEDVLREEGVTELGKYAVKPGEPLMKDLFLD